MANIVDDEHKKLRPDGLRELLAKYAEVEMLLKLGEYKSGSDPTTDEAVQKIEQINRIPQARNA